MDAHRNEFLQRFQAIRRQTEALCSPLEIEDYVVQPIVDVSPPKWHLAHTTWFFETFLLQRFHSNFKPHNPFYNFLFNSYYNSVGARTLRQNRGDLSRPTVKEVYRYRSDTDEQMASLILTIDEAQWNAFSKLLELGLHHEQQHQELLLTDIKFILSQNPSKPVYIDSTPIPTIETVAKFINVGGGKHCIGFNGSDFCFDNERPHHAVWIDDFQLQNRLTTNREYLDFINDGGYRDFRHWLSEGWDWVQREGWTAPLYWEHRDGEWFEFTLSGSRPLNPNAPVCHISYFEAEAFASWSEKRLPAEAEWEIVGKTFKAQTNNIFLESNYFHPQPLEATPESFSQFFGDVWEWTASAYLPYPNYKKLDGAIGEYNGKFMMNQMVLRGGSAATPRSHIRATYRNFFHPDKRWQFTGVRLAQHSH